MITVSDYILLTLHGSALDPDEADSALGIKASSKRYVGQAPYSPITGERGKPRERAVWQLDTTDHVPTTDLRDHVDWLLTHVDASVVARLPGLERASLSLGINSTHDLAEVLIDMQLMRFALDIGALLGVSFQYWPDDNADTDPEKVEPA